MWKTYNLSSFHSYSSKFTNFNKRISRFGVKLKKLLLFCFIFLIIFSIPYTIQIIYADTPQNAQSNAEAQQELNVEIDEQLNDLNLQELQDYLNNLQDNSFMEGKSVVEKLKDLITGDMQVNYNNVFSAMFSLVGEKAKDMLPIFAIIIAICLLLSILNSISPDLNEKSVGTIVHFACYSAVLILVLSMLVTVAKTCISTMLSLKKQMEIVFPILLTLMAASGGNVSAVVYQPIVVFLSGGISQILTEIVFPISLILIVLAMTAHLSKEIKLKQFTGLFKNLNKWIIGFSITVFSIFLTVQGITAASYDGISIKAAKYAISNSVPIVGGFLSTGFDLVLAAGVLLKNSLGSLSVFLIVFVLAEPVITLVSFSILLKLSAAAAESMGAGAVSDFLSDATEGVNYMLAALLCLAFLYLITVLLILCTAGYII